MKKSYDSIGNFNPRNVLTVGSGIRYNTPEAMLYAAKTIPELGIITAKSTGPLPRAGNLEPILTNPEPGTLMNAVGLTNPGAEASAYEAKWLREQGWPSDVMLVWSIFPGGKEDSKFNGTEQDLVYVAGHLAPYVDGLEINFGCPHSCDLAVMGCNPKVVEAYTRAVVNKVNVPVLAKLTPSAEHIGEIAHAAENGGASAIVAINTVGPLESEILSAGKGSLSGKAIRARGIACVEEIADAVDLPIIAMAGIFDADNVRNSMEAGADFCGISSGALIGMSTSETKHLFSWIVNDLKNGTNKSAKLVRQNTTYMRYEPFEIRSIEKQDDDLRVFTFSHPIDSCPGQYVSLKIPKVGEKPFSIASNNPLTIAVRKVGKFTSSLFELAKGDVVSVRGPYGNSVPGTDFSGSDVYLVAGGTGAAPILSFANLLTAYDKPTIVIGGKNAKQLLFEKELDRLGELHVATDDGSKGFHGFATDCLENLLAEKKPQNPMFLNCGPEKMMYTAAQIELKYARATDIICSIERHMSCDVGICGKCSIGGKFACVDGTYFDFEYLSKTEFGQYKRGKYGERVI